MISFPGALQFKACSTVQEYKSSPTRIRAHKTPITVAQKTNLFDNEIFDLQSSLFDSIKLKFRKDDCFNWVRLQATAAEQPMIRPRVILISFIVFSFRHYHTQTAPTLLSPSWDEIMVGLCVPKVIKWRWSQAPLLPRSGLWGRRECEYEVCRVAQKNGFECIRIFMNQRMNFGNNIKLSDGQRYGQATTSANTRGRDHKFNCANNWKCFICNRHQ